MLREDAEMTKIGKRNFKTDPLYLYKPAIGEFFFETPPIPFLSRKGGICTIHSDFERDGSQSA